ncbi:S26 family signal peptidase [Acidobacteriota bacterium]
MSARNPATTNQTYKEITLSGQDTTALFRQALRKGVSVRFQATGSSMSPFTRNGDMLTLSPLSGAGPRIGDVIAFVKPQTEKLLIHRVIKKKGKAYLCKGDNAAEADGLVPQDRILGRVERIERKGKKVSLGSGPERIFVANLSRRGWLLPIVRPLARLIRPFKGLMTPTIQLDREG